MLIQSSILPLSAFTRLMASSPDLVHDTWRIQGPSSLLLNQGVDPYTFPNTEEISYSLSIRETSSQSLAGLIYHQNINYLFFCGDITIAVGLHIIPGFRPFWVPNILWSQSFSHSISMIGLFSSLQHYNVSNFDLSRFCQLINFIINWFIYPFQGAKISSQLLAHAFYRVLLHTLSKSHINSSCLFKPSTMQSTQMMCSMIKSRNCKYNIIK